MEQKDFEEKVTQAFDTLDTTSDFDPVDAEDNKVMAILAYISILVFVPIFAAKESKFARFHANQGLVLLIFEAVLGIVLGVVSGISTALLPVTGMIFNLLGWVVELAVLVLAFFGIINAVTGKAKELPIIGSIKILK